MFHPAKWVLDICDQYGAKLHFLYRNWSAAQYAQCPERELNLKDAIARGYDVQLHFYLQWIGAELKNGQWILNFNKWNTPKVNGVLLDEWIGLEASYLRWLLLAVDPEYELLSFRPGGWMCQT